MGAFADHHAYIAAAPGEFRSLLGHYRDLLRKGLPESEEMIAYNLPGFRVEGKVVASYAAFTKQIGLYFLGPAIAEHAEEIRDAGFKATKTGITFTPKKPLPDALVEKLAKSSRRFVGD